MSLLKLPLFFAFLITYLTGSAQVSGYLGKKITVEPGMNISFTLLGPTAANNGIVGLYADKETSLWHTSRRYGLDFGYLIARNRQLILGYNYFKTGMVLNIITPSLISSGLDMHSLFMNPTCHTINLGYRIFAKDKGSLPPLGVFHSFNLQASFVNSPIVDKKTTLQYNDAPGHAPLGIDTKKMIYTFGYRFGENILLNDFLMVSYGWQFNIPLRLPRPYNGLGNSLTTNQLEYNTELNKRMLYHNLFYLNFGIGFIL